MYFGKILKSRSLVWQLSIIHTLCFSLAIAGLVYLAFSYIKRSEIRHVDEFVGIEVAELKEVFDKAGAKGTVDSLIDEANEVGTGRIFYRLYSISTPEFYSSSLREWSDLHSVKLNQFSENYTSTVYMDSRESNVRFAYYKFSPDWILEVGYLLNKNEAYLHSSLLLLIGLALCSTVISMLVGYLMIKRAFQRVDQVSAIALTITEENFSNRIPVVGIDDEIENLAKTLNLMLDRIAGLITGLRQIIDDLSHELRTPLTRLRIEAEVLLRHESDKEQWQNFGVTAIEEADRLVETVNSILDISETSAHLTKLDLQPVDIVELLRETCVLFDIVALEAQVEINISGIDSCLISADRKRLERVFSNIMDNAIKYNATPGIIDIKITEQKEKVIVSFEDFGIGISKEEIPFVFDRFYRSKKAKDKLGNGLGLSLAKAIIDAHSGEIFVESTPGKGTTFTVTLLK